MRDGGCLWRRAWTRGTRRRGGRGAQRGAPRRKKRNALRLTLRKTKQVTPLRLSCPLCAFLLSVSPPVCARHEGEWFQVLASALRGGQKGRQPPAVFQPRMCKLSESPHRASRPRLHPARCRLPTLVVGVDTCFTRRDSGGCTGGRLWGRGGEGEKGFSPKTPDPETHAPTLVSWR